MTNLLATIIVCVTTNVYQPTQYLDTSYGCLVYGCGQDHSVWVDAPPSIGGMQIELPGMARQRLNPDVRITEIRETKTVRFSLDGKDYAVEIENAVVFKTVERRKVTTQEEWSHEP
jgi:hypothetical protein